MSRDSDNFNKYNISGDDNLDGFINYVKEHKKTIFENINLEAPTLDIIQLQLEKILSDYGYNRAKSFSFDKEALITLASVCLVTGYGIHAIEDRYKLHKRLKS